MPRFDQSFTGLCEQNLQDTLQLKQRYLVDAKSKRVPKSKDKKQQESIQSSVHVQQKFLKRPSEEPDPSASVPNDNFDPPVKLQCTTQQHGSHQNDGLTKFSVEIVQQLEFTTSAANSQPQQISTNVTVKAHTNASVKSDVSSPKSNPSTPASNLQKPNNNIGLVDVGTLVECVKQEPDNDFADLDQCAAALEKDAAANGGAAFGGFTDFIGEDTSDEIMSSAAFKDLISDITTNYPDYPELMKFDFEGSKFDFEDKPEVNGNNLKVEETANDNTKNTHSPLVQNQNNYSPPVFENNQNVNKPRPNNMSGYSNMDFAKTELSPAAQTLKQMAEQHQQQHKNQMGLSFNPNARAAPASRSPYPDFQFQGDYGSPNSNTFHKNSPSFTQPDGMIKQEMIFQNNEYDMKRKGATMYKQQQYSPYNSPSASSHGSPSYLPRGGNGAPGNGPAAAGSFRTGTPPRPPSGPGGNGGPGATLQINQAQQLNISQQNHGHAIQVSAGQHLHLSGDLKGNVSIAAQQGLHFNQQQHCSPNNGGPPQNQPQQPPPPTNPQQNPLPTQHSQQHQSASSMPPNMNSQHSTMNQNAQSVPQSGNNMMSGGQQMPNSQHGPMGGPGNMPGGMGGMVGGPGGMQQHSGGMPGNLGDGYSMSQTQTINFTQQTLRRSGGPGGVPAPMPTNGPMGPGPMVQGGMGPRLINAQALDQQKLLHQQQQLLRAQQAAMQQHMVRPPPPDYKTSAGMIQGVPPRYAPGPPPNIRRMPHQPMPPSGPMIRSNMYMIQQQQQQELQQQQRLAQQRNMYPRQPGPPIGGMDSIQHGSTEWRHLVMQQQQNSSFNPMRPNFQQGFGMNSGNMQMSALQHQQIRTQQGMVAGGMSGGGAQQGMAGQGQVMAPGPMAQMNNMSQAMLHMQQQNMMQQNSQMSMTNLHLQQSQSVTVSNQGMPQQQQQQHPNISGHMANNPNNQLQQAQQQQQQQQQQNSALNNFNPQADFTFEFLDTLPTTDSGGFTDQELLNSFDTDAGFTLDF